MISKSTTKKSPQEGADCFLTTQHRFLKHRMLLKFYFYVSLWIHQFYICVLPLRPSKRPLSQSDCEFSESLFHTTPHHTTPYHTTLYFYYYSTLYFTILQSAMLTYSTRFAIPCYAMLRSSLLCSAMLCYAMPCCVKLLLRFYTSLTFTRFHLLVFVSLTELYQYNN